MECKIVCVPKRTDFAASPVAGDEGVGRVVDDKFRPWWCSSISKQSLGPDLWSPFKSNILPINRGISVLENMDSANAFLLYHLIILSVSKKTKDNNVLVESYFPKNIHWQFKILHYF